MDKAPVLLWTTGCEACWHDVYFGTDAADTGNADVSDGTGTYRGRCADASYATGELEPGGSYYWRVDEVEADGATIHKGDLWSFTTAPAPRGQP